MISLPDVNVLLALAAAGHIHHVPAKEWFDTREADSVAVCRITQMGMLRLLTNPKVLTSGSLTIRRAWDVWSDLIADKRVFFRNEPPELEAAWAALMEHPAARPSGWTDAYLAAVAEQCDYEMVTFDRNFRRWTELPLTLL